MPATRAGTTAKSPTQVPQIMVPVPSGAIYDEAGAPTREAESARSRIAFLILDAPPHHQDSIIESLKSSITFYAKNGIKLIPVAASGVDKDTESLLRFFDIVTGSTYIFLTDDCGIGYPHTEASVGDHEVEKIADLMLRLIKKYVE